MTEPRAETEGKTGLPTPNRNKPERPRDALGRPQPWDAVNVLELEDFDNLPMAENHQLACAHFNGGAYFPAHEAWETAWKQARDTDDAEFFKGLSQLGAGYVHLLRGNRHGAMTLLTRAERRIRTYPEGHHGIDTTTVADRAKEDAARVEAEELIPGESALDPPVQRPTV